MKEVKRVSKNITSVRLYMKKDKLKCKWAVASVSSSGPMSCQPHIFSLSSSYQHLLVAP